MSSWQKNIFDDQSSNSLIHGRKHGTCNKLNHSRIETLGEDAQVKSYFWLNFSLAAERSHPGQAFGNMQSNAMWYAWMQYKTPRWTCHAAADYKASPEEKLEVLNYAHNTAEDTPTSLKLIRNR